MTWPLFALDGVAAELLTERMGERPRGDGGERTPSSEVPGKHRTV